MAAELGTMRVTDQIDALQTLSTNPQKYLVAPRLLAGIVAMPLLVVIDVPKGGLPQGVDLARLVGNAFAGLDRNGDGTLSADEFGRG